MKKLVSVVSAAALIAAAASMSVSATEVNPGNVNTPVSTTVTLNLDSMYTVTIPASVNLTETAAGSGIYSGSDTIAASDVRIPNGQKIKVTVNSDFELAAGTATLTYKMTANGTEVADGGIAAEFTEDDSVALGFETTSALQYSGNYSDTMTFNISVE